MQQMKIDNDREWERDASDITGNITETAPRPTRFRIYILYTSSSVSALA